MNILIQPPKTKLEPEQRFMCWQIGWEGYEKIVEALAERPIRTTYYGGDLELMSPLPIHETIKVWFGHFLLALSLELHFAYRSMSQTTFRRRDRDRGLEPDDCFYLSGMDKVVDWDSLNLDRDPPPDLAVEVDITSSSLDRMGVYAGLEVPEVWRYDGEKWHIHVLTTAGSYRESVSSKALPYLSLSEINTLFLETLPMADNSERFRIFTSWARERMLPLKRDWEQDSPSSDANP